MTSRFKDFGAGVGQSSDEPLVFRLHGEEFQCHSNLPGKTILDFVIKSASDSPADSAQLVEDFFNTVLKADNRDRFNALVSDPERVVTVETLAEITSWLMEAYTNRPEKQPEAS